MPAGVAEKPIASALAGHLFEFGVLHAVRATHSPLFACFYPGIQVRGLKAFQTAHYWSLFCFHDDQPSILGGWLFSSSCRPLHSNKSLSSRTSSLNFSASSSTCIFATSTFMRTRSSQVIGALLSGRNGYFGRSKSTTHKRGRLQGIQLCAVANTEGNNTGVPILNSPFSGEIGACPEQSRKDRAPAA